MAGEAKKDGAGKRRGGVAPVGETTRPGMAAADREDAKLPDRRTTRVDRRALSGFDLSRREASFSFRMREIIKLFASGLVFDLRNFDVTMGQWQFLRALWEADGRSQRELGNELNITSAATVFAVNMLERDGLATREPDPTDSRRTLIFLTLKGHQLRAQLLPFARQIQLDAFEGFTDEEIASLDLLLDKMKDNLQRSIRRRAPEAAKRKRAMRAKDDQKEPASAGGKSRR